MAYLLIFGELPNKEQLAQVGIRIMRVTTFCHENMTQLFHAYRYDAHPMGMMIGALAFMSTLYWEASNVENADIRLKQVRRILGEAAHGGFCYRHRIGRPFNYPNADMGYAENFLHMLDYMYQTNYEVNPVLAKALDVLFIPHADHMSRTPRHRSCARLARPTPTRTAPWRRGGGALWSATRRRQRGGRQDAERDWRRQERADLHRIASKKGEFRLTGFGHRLQEL